MVKQLLTASAAADEARKLRSAGRRVVFTNGCFDILHPGHIKTLQQARAEGDVLIVGLNSDSSVRRLKGADRPLVPQAARASVLLALRCVDFVVVFAEDTPAALIELIKPDVLAKGGDWGVDEIVGRETVERGGGRVVRIEPVPGHSTSALIARARRTAAAAARPEPADRPVVVGVIPARYGSTRFPGKPLALIAGVPMVERVRRRVAAARLLNRVVVATDDERIARVVEEFGGEFMMTDPETPSGTDRVVEVANAFRGDLFVNVQGDEPLLPPEAVDVAVEAALTAGTEDTIVTLAEQTSGRDAFENPDVVKAVCRNDGQALYFSRAGVPHPRAGDDFTFLKHVGLYVYSRPILSIISGLAESALELREKLEQLRWLEAGIRVRVVIVDWDTIAVDRPEDIARVEAELTRRGDQ